MSRLFLPKPAKPPAGRAPGGISRRTFLLGGGSTLAGLTLGDALLLAPRDLQVQEITLKIPKIPPGREVRLVHLSDLHIRTFGDYHRQVAAMANSLEPQAILLTGDYLEQGRNIGEVRRFLELLQAPQGIYAIQGNWEYWSRLEGENLRRHFARAGTTLLINERFDLELEELPFSLLGLDYPSSEDELRVLGMAADSRRINIVLSHVPAFDHQRLDPWADLILSGHTHGGQVRIPGVTPFYLPRFSAPFVAGLYRVASGIPLYVTRGIGTSVLPVRFLCPPEVTLLRLTGKV